MRESHQAGKNSSVATWKLDRWPLLWGRLGVGIGSARKGRAGWGVSEGGVPCAKCIMKIPVDGSRRTQSSFCLTPVGLVPPPRRHWRKISTFSCSDVNLQCRTWPVQWKDWQTHLGCLFYFVDHATHKGSGTYFLLSFRSEGGEREK